MNRVRTVRPEDISLESTSNRFVSPDPLPLPIDSDDEDEETVPPLTPDAVPDDDADDVITFAPRTFYVAQANLDSFPSPPDLVSPVTNNEGHNTVLEANTDSLPGPPDMALPVANNVCDTTVLRENSRYGVRAADFRTLHEIEQHS